MVNINMLQWLMGKVLLSEKLIRIFSQTVIYIDVVGNIIILRTISGSALSGGRSLGFTELGWSSWNLAGDNTIFAVAQNTRKSTRTWLLNLKN